MTSGPRATAGIVLILALFGCGHLLAAPDPLDEARPVSISDPLDAVLNLAGMRRSDLGFTLRGWWMRYPRAVLHKLDHLDDLRREPLAAVPFTRALTGAVRDFLGAAGLAQSDRNESAPGLGSWGTYGTHSLHRLASAAVGLRHGGQALRYSAHLSGREAPLEDAIVFLYRYSGHPTTVVSAFESDPTPIEAEIRRKAATLSPEVNRILGRLVLDVVDAHRHATLAFRHVTLEKRAAVSMRMDRPNALGVFRGFEYADILVFDDVAKSWDEASLWDAGLKCVEALDRAHRALQALPKEKLKSAALDWHTPLGWIRVRGDGNDIIDASESLLVVDLGGDDIWRGSVGASSSGRIIGLALDLSGDDVYEGESATQGAGIVGVGILLDAAGDDRYAASHYAQGVAQFGLGALIDLGGNDMYAAQHVAQGSASFGIGLLLDAAGDDRYELFTAGQGFGGPGGVGLLADRSGNDIYHAEPKVDITGRRYLGSKTSPSAAQGVGVGRVYIGLGNGWAGGLGALIDIEGHDRYVAGTWSQGAGIDFGTGLLYDGAGNDHYEGGELWTQGSAAHFALGVLMDGGGDDVHHAGNGMAFAHDFSVAVMFTSGGADRYTLTHRGLGYSLNRSIALFVDVGGNDNYEFPKEQRPGFALYDPRFEADEKGLAITDFAGMVNPFFSYVHSIGLFLDVGGTDTYSHSGADGATWGDRIGSDNWRIRNMGVGMDTTSGAIDWRPLSGH